MNRPGALCRRARERGLCVDWGAAPRLGALLATGPGAGAFLQSQLTSDVLALAPGATQPSARLTRAGALVCDLHVARLPERGQPYPTYLLLADRARLAALGADLDAHVVSEDLLLDEVTGDFEGRLLLGPAAPAALAALATGPDAPARAIPLELPLTGDAGTLVLQPRGAQPALAEAVAAVAGAHELVAWPDGADGDRAWDWLRLEAGGLRAGVDYVPGRRALAQTGLETSVASFSKGCYLGQEVVARVRTYGSVPEALRALLFAATGDGCDADAPPTPAPGAPLCDADGARRGTWASAGWSPVWGAPFALAFLDREHRTPGSTFDLRLADGTIATAQVRLSPLHAAADAAGRARHLYERGVHRFNHGDDDAAIDLLQQALRADSTLADAFEALGVILGRRGRHHEAIAIFRQLEEVAPAEPLVHVNLSLFYQKLGDRTEAERQRELATLKRFAGVDDRHEAAARAEAEARARRLDAERKLAMFGEVLAVDPHDALALSGLGNALAALDRHAEAEPLFARARQAQPDNSALYLAHGRSLERLARGGEAAAAYRAGVAVASRKGDLQPLREMEHRLLLLGVGA